jgi:hypothetical protein
MPCLKYQQIALAQGTVFINMVVEVFMHGTCELSFVEGVFYERARENFHRNHGYSD